MTRLTGIRRGVKDPAATASWLGWLLDVEPRIEGDHFRFECANGWLVIHADSQVPVAVDLDEVDASLGGPDPDGVPVNAAGAVGSGRREEAVRLDHVRLNCADLAGTAEFYRRLGFALTWSGRGDDELDGLQEAPLEGADWLHLSGSDGYLSLSQADWQDYRLHSTASGPPRFVTSGSLSLGSRMSLSDWIMPVSVTSEAIPQLAGIFTSTTPTASRRSAPMSRSSSTDRASDDQGSQHQSERITLLHTVGLGRSWPWLGLVEAAKGPPAASVLWATGSSGKPRDRPPTPMTPPGQRTPRLQMTHGRRLLLDRITRPAFRDTASPQVTC